MQQRLLPRTLSVLLSVVALAALVKFYWARAYPPIPEPLTLAIRFPTGDPGAVEPLVTTGHFSNGDFLTIRFTDSTHAVFGYDSWGTGGPSSEPFAFDTASTHALEIEMPSLTRVDDPTPGGRAMLRVALDGKVLLEQPVSYHGRGLKEVYFATNPIGGNPAPAYRGALALPSGERLRGSFFATTPWRIRLGALVSAFGRPFGVAAVILIASCFGVAYALTGATRRFRTSIVHRESAGFRSAHLAGLVCATAACFVFAGLMTGGTFRLNYADSFGQFYDFQAVSLLEGRLDVPTEALPNEAFIYAGKHYGYFGPTPAVLRIPFVLADVAFGKLTRCLMVAYFAACLAAAYAMLTRACRLARQSAPKSWMIALFTTAMVGSTLLFLGDRAYIYHEAILCGTAFALWSIYGTLRFIEAPLSRWWIVAVVCGLAAVHARPPSGLFALVVLGFAAAHRVVTILRANGRGWRALVKPLAIGSVAVLAVLSFNGLSFLKFRSFDGAPLKYHVQYNAERLARFGGKNFHRENIPHNFGAYVWRPNFNLQRRFPWVYIGGHEGEYPKARLDMAEPTLGLPFAMPALCVLAMAGFLVALAQPALRVKAVVVFAGVVPMTLALLTAVATSQRYTADFCPFLIVCAAWSFVGLLALPSLSRRLFASLLWALAALSVGLNLAFALYHQNENVWGTPPEIHERYQRLQARANELIGSR
jgi:hypothetical protein